MFYGPQNAHLNLLKKKYPKLQLVARGDEIKVFGDEASIQEFQFGMQVLEKLYTTRKELTENIIQEALDISDVAALPTDDSKDVLFIGTRGQKIRAKTKNQHRMLEVSQKAILFLP